MKFVLDSFDISALETNNVRHSQRAPWLLLITRYRYWAFKIVHFLWKKLQWKMALILEHDYVVIGAGINGTWTALHLAKRGCRTLLIDQVFPGFGCWFLLGPLRNPFQFALPHSRGSSGGQTRIIRKAYDKQYLREMMNDAYSQWRGLEKTAGGIKLIE